MHQDNLATTAAVVVVKPLVGVTILLQLSLSLEILLRREIAVMAQRRIVLAGTTPVLLRLLPQVVGGKWFLFSLFESLLSAVGRVASCVLP